MLKTIISLGDSIVWKEIINHRKYIEVGLKWCIGDCWKVCFWIDHWVYMSPLISFVEEHNFQAINWDAKVYDFNDHDRKEWDLHSIAAFLPYNILANIKAVPIPTSSLDDRFCWGFSQDGRFSLKSTTWTMRKPSSHPIQYFELDLETKTPSKNKVFSLGGY